jgi:hypothetical protein
LKKLPSETILKPIGTNYSSLNKKINEFEKNQAKLKTERSKESF